MLAQLHREGGSWLAWLVVLVAARLATSIHYIEDPDSLRFALSVLRYSVADQQPHFPGYPVFSALVRVPYWLTGSYSVAFAVVGGLATTLLAATVCGMAGLRARSWPGTLAVLAVATNPMVWLLSNRFMPDLMGAAVAMAAVLAAWRRAPVAAAVLLGLLAGLRLSCLPFAALPVLWAIRGRPRAWLALAGAVLLWLVPLVAITGWGPLLESAGQQTTGHFQDFGGTIDTEPELGARLLATVESIWADGLGFWWPGRHPVTVLPALALVVALAGAAWRRFAWGPWALAVLPYLAWAFLYQNVVHKPRHLLPVVAALLVLLTVVGLARWPRLRRSLRVAWLSWMVGTAVVTAVLVEQHRQPTAIAQVLGMLREEPAPIAVAGNPLVTDYLRRQGLEARYIPVETPGQALALASLEREGPLFTVGDLRWALGREPDRSRAFFHNPYVNRMWAEVPVHVYD